jgi:undecaprenyl phosphate-alpha-L-ara4N flippase subunit ArnE
MLKLLLLSILQSIGLAAGQLCLKQALMKAGAFEWTWKFFSAQLTNWWFLAVGITMGSATILWCHILKNYPFSAAYPLTSLSYVFGMLLGMFFLQESIPFSRWIGVFLILAGSYFMVK